MLLLLGLLLVLYGEMLYNALLLYFCEGSRLVPAQILFRLCRGVFIPLQSKRRFIFALLYGVMYCMVYVQRPSSRFYVYFVGYFYVSSPTCGVLTTVSFGDGLMYAFFTSNFLRALVVRSNERIYGFVYYICQGSRSTTSCRVCHVVDVIVKEFFPFIRNFYVRWWCV